MKKYFFWILIVSVSIIQAQNWKENIKNEIQALIKDPDLNHARIGFCVLNASSGKPLYEFNSQELLVPASTMKTLTTSTALKILGKDYRYETKLYYTGEFDEKSGSLNGNLVVLGSGDPSLGSAYFQKENDTVTDVEKEFVNAIIKKGIKKINGKIIADNSALDNAIPLDWTWSDAGNYYGSPPNGLSFMDNKFKVFLSTGETGSKAKIIKTDPSNLEFKLVNNVFAGKSTDENVEILMVPGENAKIMDGLIPPNKKTYTLEGAITTPEIYFIKRLEELLKRNGVEFKLNEIRTEEQKKHIITHYSPKLEKLVYYCNLKSNNHYAESLLRTIGMKQKGEGTTRSGILCAEEYWKKSGLDLDGLMMNDGSGLSRTNGITPFLQAQILHKTYNDSAVYKAFDISLPVSGESGSLTSLGKGTCIEGKLRAK
ncbi:MAG: D-alanyl-D-alanine carboxypeptidase/D-alanyl-D-alanine-endopeptidase, partial [Bacteroidota bacterium]